ncbi:MAG: type 2 isopentenyl-diphosphate Delta-isomerase [Furfurilactobacillus sp.]|jgi:isopentenyl-diphosphate delta-isomerase|uniref:Isopentenyl-diphosphate delta-isomerase n=1 Tax=Furfurilactobacillus milii TaxID=2888272 RepID=A0ABT6D7A7_9LACO|nr:MULTISPECIES: type 2 isopentenyl-diphosphate Delta-isomerase [Furfurilactobacillus]QLE66615.1 Isopentenyl-diphosphate delta-isomerase FMN-dependent [Furfurilactobacillus rossiae]MCF6160066.1 type 2 isopentenyl-diphosphate Delta-isomerase [Furfurilactobacillus milii]MCF6162385.1 type 2 isopentenyl-diphosphate Delta-isomerase [Furfurilactobacillus milii]MCF6419905.1 type 2 isopentenyl-diphosphate Delta-isomerase [Furfurilactobacillus milii]MCH4010680.1 type 2 isopentenyl-diphosphate Delta-iso
MSKLTESAHAHRKDEHLAIALKQYQEKSDAGFDDIQIIHQSLPEIAVDNVDLSTHFAGLTLSTPFYIEAMTGGSERTGHINAKLAEIAAATGLAMAVGSQSIALKEPAAASTFTIVRKVNPHGQIFANIGAGHSLDDAQRLVDMVAADALELHINSAQELIMPEGDRDLRWRDHITEIVNGLSVPVIVKEVGFGMSQETINTLKQMGVQYINVSGRGGTNFARIENERRHHQELSYLSNWGQTTVQSLLEAHAVSNMQIAASGGVRTPLDVLKALILGANAVGVAGHFLRVLMTHDEETLHTYIKDWQSDLRLLYALTGSHTTADLRTVKTVLSPALMNYCQQRNLKGK